MLGEDSLSRPKIAQGKGGILDGKDGLGCDMHQDSVLATFCMELSCLSATLSSKSSIQASAGPLVSLLADCMIFLIFPAWVGSG